MKNRKLRAPTTRSNVTSNYRLEYYAEGGTSRLCCCLAWLTLRAEKWMWYVPPQRWALCELHSVTVQRTVLFTKHVKSKGKFVPVLSELSPTPWRRIGGGYIDHIFLTSALVGGEWSASRPGRFTPGIHWIGGWVDRRAGLDDFEKRKFLTLQGLKLRPLCHPAPSQSLYRLHYPGSSTKHLIYSLLVGPQVLAQNPKPALSTSHPHSLLHYYFHIVWF
jgi:hypothetical protein